MKPDGTSEWVFESHQVSSRRKVHGQTMRRGAEQCPVECQGTRDIHPLDWRIFWGGLLFAPLLWCVAEWPDTTSHVPHCALASRVVFGIFAALKSLQWLIVVLVALALNGANVVGYVKCSNGSLWLPLRCVLPCHALTCLPCPSEAKNKLKSAVTQGALSALTRNASLFGQIAGAAGGAGANEQLGAAAV